MAKQGNVVIIGKDGKIAIVDCNGHIAVIEKKKLGSKLSGLMEQRQAAGIALSKALAKAGFNVCASQESFVMDVTEYKKKK